MSTLQFIRLLFEATGTKYKDSAQEVGQDSVQPYMKGTFSNSGKRDLDHKEERKCRSTGSSIRHVSGIAPSGLQAQLQSFGTEIVANGVLSTDENPTPFAPPVLRHGKTVVSQTPNILLYIATRVGPVDLEGEGSSSGEPMSTNEPALFHALAHTLTILDLNNEVHDTHHPIDVAEYYEKQKDAAKQKAAVLRASRIPKFFTHFEANIQKRGTGFLGSKATFADLALFQVVEGVSSVDPLASAAEVKMSLAPNFADSQSAMLAALLCLPEVHGKDSRRLSKSHRPA